MKDRRLLYFITEDWYFCSHRLSLARAARSEGWRVGFVGRLRQHGPLIEQSGIEVFPLEISRGGINPLFEGKILHELIRIIRKFRPHLLHTVGWKPAIYGAWAAKRGGVPHRLHAMAGFGFLATSTCWKAQVLAPIARFLLKMGADAHFLVQNPEDGAELQRWLSLPPSRLHLIRGVGVDLEAWRPLPEPPSPPVVFALVGRMLRDKGIGEFVEAIQILRGRGVPIEGWLVGDVDPENPSSLRREQLRLWEERGIIRWFGYVRDVREVWHRAHVAVLPSYREGLPKALLEAAACGRPMVATDAPGIREIAVDGETAKLVPLRCAPLLAEAMQELAQNRELRQRLGKHARRKVEQEFALPLVTKQTLELYERISSNRRFQA